MALYTRSSGGRAELVATLVNALAHHGLAVDPSVAVEHIENLAHGGEHERWLKSQIDRITAELGSLGGLRAALSPKGPRRPDLIP